MEDAWSNAVTYVALRWLHIISGIIWMGMLYYFNFVNVALMKKLDAPTKGKVVTELMPRALFWFRYGAVFTLLTGLAYLWKQIGELGMGYFGTGPGKTISIGIALALIMFINVWFVIWPRQKKIIAAMKAAINGVQPPAEMARWSRVAYLASRTNTYLSFPMLFFMTATSHLPGLFD